VVKSIVRMIEF